MDYARSNTDANMLSAGIYILCDVSWRVYCSCCCIHWLVYYIAVEVETAVTPGVKCCLLRKSSELDKADGEDVGRVRIGRHDGIVARCASIGRLHIVIH